MASDFVIRPEMEQQVFNAQITERKPEISKWKALKTLVVDQREMRQIEDDALKYERESFRLQVAGENQDEVDEFTEDRSKKREEYVKARGTSSLANTSMIGDALHNEEAYGVIAANELIREMKENKEQVKEKYQTEEFKQTMETYESMVNKYEDSRDALRDYRAVTWIPELAGGLYSFTASHETAAKFVASQAAAAIIISSVVATAPVTIPLGVAGIAVAKFGAEAVLEGTFDAMLERGHNTEVDRMMGRESQSMWVDLAQNIGAELMFGGAMKGIGWAGKKSGALNFMKYEKINGTKVLKFNDAEAKKYISINGLNPDKLGAKDIEFLETMFPQIKGPAIKNPAIYKTVAKNINHNTGKIEVRIDDNGIIVPKGGKKYTIDLKNARHLEIDEVGGIQIKEGMKVSKIAKEWSLKKNELFELEIARETMKEIGRVTRSLKRITDIDKEVEILRAKIC